MNNAAIGHNQGPDMIDEITAQYADTVTEATESWLDGQPVTNEGQMKAVDALRKDMRTGRLALVAAEKSEVGPLYDVYKAEKARWKPTIDDFKRIEDGLVSSVNVYKQKLAADKREAERKAYEEADRKRREAEEAASKADASDIEAQREAAALAQDAMDAKQAASAATKDKVKGLRTVTHYDVTDHRDLLNHIVKVDREAITAFIDEWARRNHKPDTQAAGLRVWTTKEAF